MIGNEKSRKRKQHGFTLVEVLIVIVTMLIIAGMVIPQFQDAIKDAEKSTTLANLHMLTTAIERYKLHHDGYPPDDVTSATLGQLTSSTNRFGDSGEGSEFRYGPYVLTVFPDNTLNDSSKVFLATVVPPIDLPQRVGWVYDPESGQIWAGEAE